MRVAVETSLDSGFARYAAECDAAAVSSARDFERTGVKYARFRAPHRTGDLIRSILGKGAGKLARWIVGTDHGLPQETGSRPHRIEGAPALKFFWEREGRWFRGPRVNHPGNPAVRFLEASYRVVASRAIAIMRRHYPG